MLCQSFNVFGIVIILVTLVFSILKFVEQKLTIEF